MRMSTCVEFTAAPMTFAYAMGEVWELVVEVLRANPAGIREEWCDAACCLQLWLYDVLGHRRDWEMVLGGVTAMEKFIARYAVWEKIFQEHGLRFEIRYVVNGGNYKKPHKVAAALELARADQG